MTVIVLQACHHLAAYSTLFRDLSCLVMSCLVIIRSGFRGKRELGDMMNYLQTCVCITDYMVTYFVFVSLKS